LHYVFIIYINFCWYVKLKLEFNWSPTKITYFAAIDLSIDWVELSKNKALFLFLFFHESIQFTKIMLVIYQTSPKYKESF